MKQMRLARGDKEAIAGRANAAGGQGLRRSMSGGSIADAFPTQIASRHLEIRMLFGDGRRVRDLIEEGLVLADQAA
ncbi:hypothetical protein WKW80_33130 [Variovorax humicola]|uniref:Uncharacterized protein n=1 Tax=Variovorax humicola TaxID=1769758 RepID=A0ABU8W9S5_9BURK